MFQQKTAKDGHLKTQICFPDSTSYALTFVHTDGCNPCNVRYSVSMTPYLSIHQETNMTTTPSAIFSRFCGPVCLLLNAFFGAGPQLKLQVKISTSALLSSSGKFSLCSAIGQSL